MKEERRTLVQLVGTVTDLVVFFLCMISTITFFDAAVVKLTDELKVELTGYYMLMLLCAICVIICFEDYQNMFKRTKIDEFLDCIKMNVLILGSSSVLLITTKNSMISSRYVFISIFTLNLILEFIARLILKKVIKYYFSDKKSASLVGILTTYDRVDTAISYIDGDWTRKIWGIGIIDKNITVDEIRGVPVVSGELKEFSEWVKKEAIDEVIIDIEYSDNKLKKRLTKLIDEIKQTGVDVHFNIHTLNEFSKYYCSVTYFGSKPMLTFKNTHYSFNKILIKRGIDIIGGLIGCIISVPIICIVAIPLLIESKGPLFFKQKRVGLNGRYFYIYKLRSMYDNAEKQKKELMDKNEMNGLMFKISDDPRVTKIGKFIRSTSIDEIPQFFNVLKGDMSLVGTRPPTVDEFKQYENYHKRRLSMKPGITGLWQISGRSDIDNFEDVVKIDLMYIDEWSLSLDIKILLKTVLVVFKKRGAK